MKKEEKLYDAITNIDDKIIEEAQAINTPVRKSWRRWTAAAAAAVILVGAGIFSVLNIVNNDMTNDPSSAPGSYYTGHNEGSVFMSYAGPVLPLTLTAKDDSIVSDRNITFDFSSLGNKNYERDIWNIDVTDSYTITNTSSSDKTVTIAYPFVASFVDVNAYPTLTIDGISASQKLYAGSYSGGFRGAGDENSTSLNLANITSWEGYKSVLEDGTYLSNALSGQVDLNEKVTVYELTDITDGGSDAVNPTLCMSFNIDPEETTVLTYGFNGGRFNTETGLSSRHFSIPKSGRRDYGAPRYLIVVGDDIDSYSLQGYKDGGCEPGSEISGAGANVQKYESTLGEILHIIAKSHYDDIYDSEYDGDANRHINPAVNFEMYYNEVCSFFSKHGLLGEDPKERYEFGMLEDIIHETVVHERVMYLTSEVTIPAGESIDISLKMQKEPSFDFDCGGSENAGILGYDMMTTLGSTLKFAQQTADITNTDNIEIIRQNFGFDIDSGITHVVLDIKQDHYYIEIRQKPITN